MTPSTITFLKLFDFNSQTNDDRNEENNQTAQDHAQLCYPIKHFYKKDC